MDQTRAARLIQNTGGNPELAKSNKYLPETIGSRLESRSVIISVLADCTYSYTRPATLPSYNLHLKLPTLRSYLLILLVATSNTNISK